MDPLVSVVVVNYNRASLLQHCLSSLLVQSFPSLEILVVDNGSTDGSPDMVESLQESRIRLIRLEANRGFAGGCNAAIGLVRGDLVALINNDAVADVKWIERLVETARTSDQGVGMWAGKVLFFDTDVIDKAGHLIYPDGQNRGRGTGERDRGQYSALEETIFPDGCAAMYRRCLLEEVGGFDEQFFAYGDDADLGMRARLMGWSCLYVPDAVVYHRHSSTSGRFSAQKVYWVERNRFWLAVKNFPLLLLLVSPVFTLNRWFWNFFAVWKGQGAAANFCREASFWTLLKTLVRCYRDGIGGLGAMVRKRRHIRRNKKLSDGDFFRLVFRFRISARVLALQDYRSGEVRRDLSHRREPAPGPGGVAS